MDTKVCGGGGAGGEGMLGFSCLYLTSHNNYVTPMTNQLQYKQAYTRFNPCVHTKENKGHFIHKLEDP